MMLGRQRASLGEGRVEGGMILILLRRWGNVVWNQPVKYM